MKKNNINFNKIKISIASPKEIKSWSKGEIKKTETINYKTLEPEKKGLFCSHIFGPTRNYSCICGKYKGKLHKNVICEICKEKISSNKKRRKRMGHIKLASPIFHIWYLKSRPSYISLLLNNSINNIEKVIYFKYYIIFKSKIKFLKIGRILNKKDYLIFKKQYKNKFKAGKGAEYIRILLKNINFKNEYKKLNKKLKKTRSKIKILNIKKKIRIFKIFCNSKIKIHWIVLNILPVLPADLRPLISLDDGNFATSDLNNLYRIIINRNNRLKKLIKIYASKKIIDNEKCLLQEAVDALFDNSKKKFPILGKNKNPLKSLSDILRGKQGRFRQNLLGKRVDYSGRTVIIVGPNLRLHQCGLPIKIALELFKPFIYSKLLSLKLNFTIKEINELIKKENKFILKELIKILNNKVILLNRAPTLHRLGIQAFKPLLIEGKSIQLHPLVCAGYNADFDGDQMAIHIPITNKSQLESFFLMLSTNNLLSPANGNPIVTPTQDMVLGIYYLVKIDKSHKFKKNIFWNLSEIIYLYNSNVLNIHTRILVQITEYKKKNNNFLKKNSLKKTTVGRILLWNIMPKGIPYKLINQDLNKNKISKILKICYNKLGINKTCILADKLMNLGFEYATKSGISICIDDIIIPKNKKKIIKKTKNKVNKIQKKFKLGLISFNEKYNKIIDTWSNANEKITKNMIKDLAINFKNSFKKSRLNSVYVMLDSGARGSLMQIHQLGGMRGLMSKPDSSIIETPITSNFREGLNVLQYFISTHGARKGLADTALKTANSGYLTRRLVNSAQDLIVTKINCKTKKGIKINSIIKNGETKITVYERILGRLTLKDIYKNNKLIIKKNTLLNDKLCKLLKKNLIDSVKVRSVVNCKSKNGICSFCYGLDLSKGSIVKKGEAVGIIAAQSIGEPGTQLTMRTFHIGGTASNVKSKPYIKVKNNGILKFINIKIIKNRFKDNIVISKKSKIKLLDKNKKIKEIYNVLYGSILLKKNNSKVNIGDRIIKLNKYNIPIISEFNGYIKYNNIINKKTAIIKKDKKINLNYITILNISKKNEIDKKKYPFLEILNKNGNKIFHKNTNMSIKYYLPEGSKIKLKNNQKVYKGDILAKIPLEYDKNKDITGGLPRISDLFEVRKPKNLAILSEITGIVEFLNETKNYFFIKINPINIKEKAYIIKFLKHKILNVFNGELVKKGSVILDGVKSLQDILRLQGLEKLTNYIINKVQNVYHPQGVIINDKHIEIIIHQMIQKVLIKDSKNNYLNEEIDYFKIKEINKKLIKKKKILYSRILSGITKISLNNNSFISSASFQETTNILVKSSIESKVDFLKGLKENIISGRLIPVGTGYLYYKNKKRIIKLKKINKKKTKKIKKLKKILIYYIKKKKKSSIIKRMINLNIMNLIYKLNYIKINKLGKIDSKISHINKLNKIK